MKEDKYEEMLHLQQFLSLCSEAGGKDIEGDDNRKGKRVEGGEVEDGGKKLRGRKGAEKSNKDQ